MNGRKSRNPVLECIGTVAGVTFLNQRNGWFLDGKPVFQTKAVDADGATAWLTDRQDRTHSCFNGLTSHEAEEKTVSFLMEVGSRIEVASPDSGLVERWRSHGFSTIEELRMKDALRGVDKR